jgi:ankyrin repeat protein
MRAVLDGATTQIQATNNLLPQPATTAAAITTTSSSSSRSHGATMQNRRPSSDPRSTTEVAQQSAIDSTDSSDPTLTVIGTGEALTAHQQSVQRFHQLVSAGDFYSVEKLLQQLPALRDAMDEQTGLTPLCSAAMHGHLNIAACLLDADAPVDACERHGSTALMFAAQAGNIQMIRRLLVAGANPNAVNQQMTRSVLVWAVNEKHLNVCQELIEAGADIHFMMLNKAGNGKTASPLDAVIARGWTALLQWLIDTKKLPLESQIIKGTTLLNFACFTGSLESVRLLLDAGANATPNFDYATNTLRGPLWSADMNGKFHVVEYLLQRGMTVPLNIPSLPFPEVGVKYFQTIDMINHADLLMQGQHANPVGLKDLSLIQSPQKLIEGIAGKKIDLLPNEKKWTHWLSQLGISTLISHEIFKHTGPSAVVFRALAGNHTSTSREQYLQALIEIVSEACTSPNLNASFSNIKLTERGEKVMNRMVHKQRALLLQAVATLREQQLQRLRTLPEVCFNIHITTSNQLYEAGLYRFLTRQWGLFDPIALAAVRLIKAAHRHVLASPVSSSALPPKVQLRNALTALLEGLRLKTLLPEFDQAVNGLGAHVDKGVYGELIFAQWRLFNDAFQVALARPLKFGPLRPDTNGRRSEIHSEGHSDGYIEDHSEG